MTTFTSLPTFRSSTSVPPGTPPPSPPPGGPTGPTPTGPGRAVIIHGDRSVIAYAEHLLSTPLALLVAEVLDGDHDPVAREHLNAAAQNISCALATLAGIQSPPVVSEEGPAPGPVAHGGAAGERPGAGFHLSEGAHRPIGRVDQP